MKGENVTFFVSIRSIVFQKSKKSAGLIKCIFNSKSKCPQGRLTNSNYCHEIILTKILHFQLTSTVAIFNLAKSSVDPYLATIIFGVMQVLGAWLSTLTMERAGRRPLLLLSSSGMAVCHCVLGIFLLIQSYNYDVSGFSWMPVCVLSAFSVLYCIGVGPIAHVVPNEVYSPDLASVSNGITLFIMTCCCFLVIKFFPLAVTAIGLHSCFFVFLLFCMCTFFFVLFNVPETRGKSMDSIRAELKGLKKSEKTREDIEMRGEINK